MSTVETLATSVRSLSKDEQLQLLSELERQGLIGLPSDKVRDFIWTAVIGAFCLVLLSTTAGLLWGLFAAKTETLVSPDSVVSLFTAAVGYLAGLFAPSPVQQKAQR